jgi:hypothetical protein
MGPKLPEPSPCLGGPYLAERSCRILNNCDFVREGEEALRTQGSMEAGSVV